MTKVQTIQIHWHEKQPIFSLDFHPTISNRFLSSGGDGAVRIWHISDDGKIIFRSTLKRHIQSVNCARWSPVHDGNMIASCSDDGTIMIWIKTLDRSDSLPLHSSSTSTPFSNIEEEIEDNLEFWNCLYTWRISDNQDLYDLCWSPDGRYILAGLTDNTAQIWELESGKKIKTLKDHRHFVQGVAWDPLNRYLITQSSDRTAKIWSLMVKATNNSHSSAINNRENEIRNNEKVNIGGDYISLVNIASKLQKNTGNPDDEFIFHDETLVTFFRRVCFSPEGSLLFFPAGISSNSTEFPSASNSISSSFYIFPRNSISINSNNSINLSRSTIQIDGFEKGVIAIKCNPRLFELIDDPHDSSNSFLSFSLPYRIIYAVVSQDTLVIFDSQSNKALFGASSMHFGTITDLAWSSDGLTLILSATDGFCTLVQFDSIELGIPIDQDIQNELIYNLRLRYGIPIISPSHQSIPFIPHKSLHYHSHGHYDGKSAPLPFNDGSINILNVKKKENIPATTI